MRQSTDASHESREDSPHAGLGSSARESKHAPAAVVVNQQWSGSLAPFQAAQAMTDSLAQAEEFERLLQDMTADKAASAISEMRTADLKGEAARRLFDHWATACPRDAAGWAQGLADSEIGQSFMVMAALRWTNQDLNQAVSWARSLPAGDARSEIMEAVCSEAVRKAPIEAMRLGAELPKGAKQTELLGRAAAEWAVTDRNSALEWVRQIEDTDLRQQVTGQMVVAFANQDPVLAATIALQEMAEGEAQNRSVVTIVEHWVQTDPEAASAWVSQFPDGRLGQEAMENLINLWAGRDLVKSGNWLLSLPSSPLQESGVLAYARVLKQSDPELASRWASSVADTSER